jgi:hypothetical protein
MNIILQWFTLSDYYEVRLLTSMFKTPHTTNFQESIRNCLHANILRIFSPTDSLLYRQYYRGTQKPSIPGEDQAIERL